MLAEDGIDARVVSLPSWELFRAQPDPVRDAIIPPGLPSVAVEAASTLGWRDLVDDVVGLDRFGASAPGEVLYAELGITPPAVAGRVRAALLGDTEGTDQ
jgi:transketolase